MKRKLEEEEAIRKLKEDELEKIKKEHDKIIERCEQLKEDTEAYKKDALRKIELYHKIARLQEENERMRYKLDQNFSFKKFIKKIFFK